MGKETHQENKLPQMQNVITRIGPPKTQWDQFDIHFCRAGHKKEREGTADDLENGIRSFYNDTDIGTKT